MTTFRKDDLVALFADEDAELRTTALTLLCEGYANDPGILESIFQAWDRFGANLAFSDFAMLSYLPATPDLIPEACQRATQMVHQRALTDPITRAAGKLIEQQMQLPAASLQPNLGLLQETVNTSKIFFRVDLELQSRRIDLLGLTADEIAVHLDSAIAQCVVNDKDDLARTKAIISLEALRRQHSEYLDLAVALSGPPKEDGPAWISFCTTLQSLIQFPQSGLEANIGQHLLDHREFVYSLAVEAMVRCGTSQAADQLLTHFSNANSRAQHWIARGLQRVRCEGIAARIAQLDATDLHLKTSLLIAQLKQLDGNYSGLGEQLRDVNSVPTGAAPLLRINQRLWPKQDSQTHLQLERVLAIPSAQTQAADKAEATRKREAIRDVLRQQIRKTD